MVPSSTLLTHHYISIDLSLLTATLKNAYFLKNNNKKQIENVAAMDQLVKKNAAICQKGKNIWKKKGDIRAAENRYKEVASANRV